MSMPLPTTIMAMFVNLTVHQMRPNYEDKNWSFWNKYPKMYWWVWILDTKQNEYVRKMFIVLTQTHNKNFDEGA
jgi:hypothetical protein